ncbi:protein CUSTOS isoform X2 [Thalassophryne amazonica]|uniref:protein CUSTOS isoform X2 n=1 Tax=Thalassophryne amazonica TaxID=390379 RepID=UPI001470A2EC|nr:protein CUSTOS isoform X2 [Thalassophryne amazonica]
MASPAAENMVDASEDSSSSNEEDLQRFKEAVWDTQRNNTKDGDGDMKHSKRGIVTEGACDGNELQVTRGFQTHVAKKLGQLLDSFITEMQPKASPCVTSPNHDDDDDDDEGFRLFSTSVPGQRAVEPPNPARRRPVPSSSGSDSEMEVRLKEAAVSLADLLPSALTTEAPDKLKEVMEGKDRHVIRKKKKKEGREKKMHVDCANSVVEQEILKVKRKKKRLPAEDAERGDMSRVS